MHGQWSVNYPDQWHNEDQVFIRKCPGTNEALVGGHLGSLHRIDSLGNVERIEIGFEDYYTDCQFLTKDIVFLCGFYHVYKSVDGGRSFEKLSDNGLTTNKEGRIFRNIHFVNSQVGYVAPQLNAKYYKTVDGGENWEKISFEPSAYNIYGGYIHFFDEERGLYFIKQGWDSIFVMRTNDGGNNWSEEYLNDSIDAPLRSFDAYNGIVAVAAGESSYSSSYGYVYVSSDSGTTWTQMLYDDEMKYNAVKIIDDTTILVYSDKVEEYQLSEGEWKNTFSINASEGNDIERIGDDLYFVGGNGLVNWSLSGSYQRPFNKTYELDLLNIEKVNEDSFYVFGVDKGTSVYSYDDTAIILHSFDRGSQWTMQRSPTTPVFYDVIISSKNWYGSQDGVIYKSEDKGQNWVSIDTMSDFSRFEALNANEVVVLGTNDNAEGVVLLIDSNSIVKELYKFGDNIITPLGVQVIDEQKIIAMYYSITGSRVVVSENSGASWDDFGSFGSYSDQFNGFVALNSNDLLAIKSSGMIFKSTDGGQSWDDHISDISVSLNAILRVEDIGIYLIGFHNGLLYFSHDDGDSFTLLEDLTENNINDIIAIGEDVIAINNKGNIFLGLDGGKKCPKGLKIGVSDSIGCPNEYVTLINESIDKEEADFSWGLNGYTYSSNTLYAFYPDNGGATIVSLTADIDGCKKTIEEVIYGYESPELEIDTAKIDSVSYLFTYPDSINATSVQWEVEQVLYDQFSFKHSFDVEINEENYFYNTITVSNMHCTDTAGVGVYIQIKEVIEDDDESSPVDSLDNINELEQIVRVYNVGHRIVIDSDQTINEYHVIGINGQVLISEKNNNQRVIINSQDWSVGYYLLHVRIDLEQRTYSLSVVN